MQRTSRKHSWQCHRKLNRRWRPSHLKTQVKTPNYHPELQLAETKGVAAKCNLLYSHGSIFVLSESMEFCWKMRNHNSRARCADYCCLVAFVHSCERFILYNMLLLEKKFSFYDNSLPIKLFNCISHIDLVYNRQPAANYCNVIDSSTLFSLPSHNEK